MKISMYQASIPVSIRALNNLSAILKKGEAYAETRKFDTGILFNARLAPDMFPLSRQIQIAADIAKGGGARLAGMEPPKFEDDETVYADLYRRIDKTIAFLQSLAADQIDGTEDKEITLKLRDTSVTFNGLTYLLGFVLPNVYFHVTTAYDILRHNGVDIGKQDYIGKL